MFPALLLVLLILCQSDNATAIEDVLATVNGEAITYGEVEALYEGSNGRLTRGEIMRQLVYSLLLHQRATEAGINVAEDELNAVMARRVESAGGWDAYRTQIERLGRTMEQDRVQIRDGLAADRYVEHCLGRVSGSEHLRPHLARKIQVTPREAQEYYRDHQASFRTEDRIEVGRLLVPKAGFAAAEASRACAKVIRDKALAGTDLAAAAAGSEHARYGTMVLKRSEEPGLRPEIRAFLETAPSGVLSPVFETPGAWIVVVKMAEEPGRPLSFDEAQTTIFIVLGELKWRAAREELSRELLDEADVWPKKLFRGSASSPSDVAPDDSDT